MPTGDDRSKYCFAKFSGALTKLWASFLLLSAIPRKNQVSLSTELILGCRGILPMSPLAYARWSDLFLHG